MIDARWDEGHVRRVRAMALIASVLMIGLGAIWCAALVMADRPLLASLHAFMIAAGAAILLLIRRGRLRLAATIEANLLPLMMGLFCLFDNVPLGVPRTTHLHLLPVAIGCYFVFRQQGLYLKFVIPGVCLIGFVMFQTTNIVVGDATLALPRDAASMGAWTNTVTAVAALVLIIVIMNADLTDRHMMEQEIRKAIANGDFRLNYQPQVDEFGRLVGAEALIRWEHARMGNVTPDRFIPLAEETGLIVPIGNWVLRAACAQLALWQARPETARLTMAVNVSASQFRQPDFVHNVVEIMRLSGVRAAGLNLELTESMLVDQVEPTVAKMKALRDLGVIWALDDFGTGYSSLGALHRFPLGQIKIDQSFVREMTAGKPNMVIIETIIALAKRLNLQVIAEGIETADEFDRLRESGCRLYQGYFFGRPMDIEAFESHRVGALRAVA